jgi:hypothetical protein
MRTTKRRSLRSGLMTIRKRAVPVDDRRRRLLPQAFIFLRAGARPPRRPAVTARSLVVILFVKSAGLFCRGHNRRSLRDTCTKVSSRGSSSSARALRPLAWLDASTVAPDKLIKPFWCPNSAARVALVVIASATALASSTNRNVLLRIFVVIGVCFTAVAAAFPRPDIAGLFRAG